MLKVVSILLVLSCVSISAVGQNPSRIFPAGSLIIGMDTAAQPGRYHSDDPPGYLGGGGGTVPFNLRSYGLVHALLNAYIPVFWCITEGKPKDGIDLNVDVEQIFPGPFSPASPGPVVNRNFLAGPFVIEAADVALALPIIAAFGDSVALYRTTTAGSWEYKYQLGFTPKLALLSTGNKSEFHDSLMSIAGIPETSYSVVLASAIGMDAYSCYTFASEPHWKDGDGGAVDYADVLLETVPMNDFVTGGGNLLVQCAGIEPYENSQHYHTTLGMEGDGSYSGAEKADTHTEYEFDHPFMQFNDTLTHDPTGTFVGWRPDVGGGSVYQPLSTVLVEKNGLVPGERVASVRKMTSPIEEGGNVFYLGGHDYRRRAFELQFVNGIRMYLNATLMPSSRPDSCGFYFITDDSLSLEVDPGPYAVGDTIQLSVIICNNGPGTSYGIQITDSLGDGFSYVYNIPSTGVYDPVLGIWTISSIPNGMCDTLILGVEITSAGSLSEIAFVSSLEPGNQLSNDTSAIMIAVCGGYPGPDTAICGPNHTLTADPLLPGFSGEWFLDVGTGILSTPLSATSSVSGLSGGVNRFLWVVSDGSCTDSSYIEITSTPTLIPNAGPADTVCGPNVNLAATLTAGSGTWSVVSGSGVVSLLSDPLASLTGLSSGANIFQWTITEGPCLDSATVEIISMDSVVADAGTDTTICGGEYSLGALPPGPGISGNWSLISGEGSVSMPANPASSLTGLAVGLNQWQWHISNGWCADSALVSIITLAPAIADPGPADSVCGNSISLTAAPSPGTGLWSILSGAGTFAVPTAFATDITGLNIGTNLLQWTVTNGPCSDSATLAITAFAPLTADAGPDTSICDEVYTMQGTSPSSGSGEWSSIFGGGSIGDVNTPNTLVSAIPAGVSSFSWQVANGPCMDADTLTIERITTTAIAGPDQVVCDVATLTLAADPSQTGSWSLISGGGIFSDSGLPAAELIGPPYGVSMLEWSYDNGACLTADTVDVENVAPPTLADAGPDQILTSGAIINLTGNAPTIGVGYWTVVTGSGTIATPTSATTLVTDVLPGSNIFTWTIENEGCPPSTSSVEILLQGLVIPTGVSPNGDGKE